jgi:hypothetical protein
MKIVLCVFPGKRKSIIFSWKHYPSYYSTGESCTNNDAFISSFASSKFSFRIFFSLQVSSPFHFHLNGLSFLKKMKDKIRHSVYNFMDFDTAGPNH